MRFFSNFFASKPSWQFNADGAVWKLLCAGNVLLGDARDVAKHTAAFFAVDIQTGEKLWNNVTLPQAWWIGMQGVIGETLLLHGFEKPDMPIPKGMYAVDLRNGNIRWTDADLTYLFTANDRVYAQRAAFRERTYFEIDVMTGAVVYDYGTNEEGIIQLRRVSTSPEEPGYVFAESLQTRDTAVRQRVEQVIDLTSVRGVVDVAQVDARTIIAWHEPAKGAQAMLNNRVCNRLNVLSGSGAILFEDMLVADAPAPVPDVFFVKDGVLLYVKESTHVTGVRLAELAQ